MSENNWSDEWPTEVGNYWFYGYPFGKRTDGRAQKPKLCFMQTFLCSGVVVGNIIPDLVGVGFADGYIFAPNTKNVKGAIGKWLRVELPTLPKL